MKRNNKRKTPKASLETCFSSYCFILSMCLISLMFCWCYFRSTTTSRAMENGVVERTWLRQQHTPEYSVAQFYVCGWREGIHKVISKSLPAD